MLLDQAVDWANELGLYLILDWHSIGNLKEEKFQHRDVYHHHGRNPAFLGKRFGQICG